MVTLAEELGAGYISLLPEMKGFSKAVKAGLKKSLASLRNVEVPVTPVLDKKALGPLSLPSQRVKVPVEVDQQSYLRSLLKLSRDSRGTVHQRVEVDVDRDRFGEMLSRSLSAGDTAAKAGTALGGAILAPISAVFSNPLTGLPAIVIGAVTAVFAALPAAILAGAATVSATLAAAGLGGILLGGFLLKDDPQIKAGLQGLLGEVKSTFAEAVKPLKGPFLESIGILKDGFLAAAPGIKDFFKGLAAGGGIQELARGFSGLMKSFTETGALKKLGEAVGPVLKQLGMALPDIGNALSQLLISFSNAAGPASRFFGALLRGTADVIRVVGGAVGWLATKWDNLVGFVKAAWQVVQDIGAGLKLLGNAVVGALTANMEKVKPLADALKGIFGDLVGKITEIPKKITGALSNAKTLLLDAGKNIVNGLIDGIRNKLGALGNIASQLAGTIRAYLPFSPAKMGPLSGSGNPFHSGQVIAADLAAGMSSQLPTVHSAATELAGSAGFGSSSRGVASAAPVVVQLEWVGGHSAGDGFMQWLRENIRNRAGGDVQMALGTGGFSQAYLAGASRTWTR